MYILNITLTSGAQHRVLDEDDVYTCARFINGLKKDYKDFLVFETSDKRAISININMIESIEEIGEYTNDDFNVFREEQQ